MIPELRTCSITAGRVGEGRYFLLMAGIGFDAYALAIALERARGRKVTFTGYTLAALAATRRYGYGPLRAECDGESWLGSSAIVGNVSRYGGNLRLTPQARLTDPELDLCLLRGDGFRSYLGVFRDVVLAGRHVRRHDVVYRRSSRFVVAPAPKGGRPGAGHRPPLLQLDGEAVGPVEAPLVIT